MIKILRAAPLQLPCEICIIIIIIIIIIVNLSQDFTCHIGKNRAYSQAETAALERMPRITFIRPLSVLRFLSSDIFF